MYSFSYNKLNKLVFFKVPLAFFFLRLPFLKQLINYENNSTFLCGINEIPKL